MHVAFYWTLFIQVLVTQHFLQSIFWLILACQPLFASLLWQRLGFLSGSKHDAKKDSTIKDFLEKLNISTVFICCKTVSTLSRSHGEHLEFGPGNRHRYY